VENINNLKEFILELWMQMFSKCIKMGNILVRWKRFMIKSYVKA